MISLFLFLFAGACRGLFELLAFKHSDSIFSGRVQPISFWGSKSWMRKYRNLNPYVQYNRMPLLKRWYYKTFKIEYPERFLLSSTALVWLTDGAHLMNFLMKFFLIGACLTYSPIWHWGWMAVAYTVAWTTGFNLSYSVIFQRRLK